MAAIAIALAMVSQGPARAQGPSASVDQPAETITLKIEGWTCRSCEKDIRRALLAVPGVKAAEVSYPRGGAVVSVEPGRVTPDQLSKAVESAGTLLTTYRASVIPNGALPEASDGTGSLTDLFKGLFK
jgi:copper chaperone CopZ